MSNEAFVTYRAFGAAGDGKTNDMAAIAAAHAYANAHQLPVRADEGAVYYIGEIQESAVICTDTDWTGAQFMIDDSLIDVAHRQKHVFCVRSTQAPYPLTGLGALKKGQSNLGVSLNAPSIVVLTDDHVRRFIREGLNQDSGKPQSDIIAVAPDGTIDPGAPLIWDFNEVTSAQVYPMDAQTLTLRGGVFTTIANQAESRYTYYNRGILINRSNVRVEQITHYVTGELDHGAPCTGFISTLDCANVTLENCLFTAHKTYRTIGAVGLPVSMGSYDLNFLRTLNLTINNCRQTTDILDTAYWGLMGSNQCKNIVLQHCVFSRFDAHEGVANITIADTTLGHQCLNAIGSGLLTVERTTLYGHSLINLRDDYGSNWEGEVLIRDCTWIPNCKQGVSEGAAIVSGHYSGFHNFGYPCTMPSRIVIDGLRIADEKHTPDYRGIYLLGDITPENTDASYDERVAREGYPYHVTERIELRGLTCDSGLPWRLSPNAYMYRDTQVIEG